MWRRERKQNLTNWKSLDFEGIIWKLLIRFALNRYTFCFHGGSVHFSIYFWWSFKDQWRERERKRFLYFFCFSKLNIMALLDAKLNHIQFRKQQIISKIALHLLSIDRHPCQKLLFFQQYQKRKKNASNHNTKYSDFYFLPNTNQQDNKKHHCVCFFIRQVWIDRLYLESSNWL